MNMETVKAAVAHVRRRRQENRQSVQIDADDERRGVLLTADIIDYLNENNISLVLSLDGRKEVHDKMRPFTAGVGSYDKVLPNLIASGCKVAQRSKLLFAVRSPRTILILQPMCCQWPMPDSANCRLNRLSEKTLIMRLPKHLPQLLPNMKNWPKRIWRGVKTVMALTSSIWPGS